MTIELQGLTKVYDNNVIALKNIHLVIQPGEFLVLVGPSGCGKSTLLRILAGLEQPSAGQTLMDDKPMDHLTPQQRNVAMVFQNYALYPHMTVRQNLQFPLRMLKAKTDRMHQQVTRVSELLNLQTVMEQKPDQLSGGQKQRVAMGRALVREPKLFLLDEPLSNLDAKLRTQIRTEISLLQKTLKTTTVYVTHDQVEAMTLGERVVVMNGGIIEQIDEPGRLYDDPANAWVATFFGSPAMNLVEGTLRIANHKLMVMLGAYQHLLEGISPKLLAALYLCVNQTIKIGFRPEMVSFNELQDYPKVIIKAIECLGHEKLVYFKFADPEIRVASGAHCAARVVSGVGASRKGVYQVEDTVGLKIDNSTLFIFAETGERIRPN